MISWTYLTSTAGIVGSSYSYAATGSTGETIAVNTGNGFTSTATQSANEVANSTLTYSAAGYSSQNSHYGGGSLSGDVLNDGQTQGGIYSTVIGESASSTFYTVYGSDLGVTSSTPSSHSSSGSTALGTFGAQTTTGTTYSADIISSTLTTFSSTLLTASSNAIVVTTASYENITNTYTTSASSTTILTSFPQQSSYGVAVISAFLPSPGEVVWLVTGGGYSDATPVSALVSTMDYFTLYQPTTILTFSPNSVSSTTTTTFSSTLNVYLDSSYSSNTTTVYESNFYEGGTSSRATPGYSYVASLRSETDYYQVSSNVTYTGRSYYPISYSSLGYISTAGTTSIALGAYEGLNNGIYSIATGPTMLTVTASISQTLNAGTGNQSFAASGSLVTVGSTSSTTATYITGFASGATNNITITTSLVDNFGYYLVINSASLLKALPPAGFRTDPMGQLVQQMGLDNATFSMATDEGSYVYSAGIQTVAVRYPFTRSWIVTNTANYTDYTSYTASWNSDTVTVTGLTTTTSVSGTITNTLSSTTSSQMQWTLGDAVSPFLSIFVEDSVLRLGSGSYYTDFTQPKTVVLQPGAYSFTDGSTLVLDANSFTTSASNVVRPIAAAFGAVGENPYFMIDVRSVYL